MPVGSGGPAPSGGARARALLRASLVVAVLVQLVVLYAPQQLGEPPFANADKVVHVLVFLAPTLLAVLGGLPRSAVVGVSAAHAVVSEVVQALLLPGRSGDPLDVVADLAGVVLGTVLAAVLAGRSGRRPS